MATQTVNEKVALAAAPATTDVIPIWDVSASAYKKITVANFLGGYMTGGGTVATGGFTLTVPATGSAVLAGTASTISGAKTFSATSTHSQIRSALTGTMDDNTAYSVTTPQSNGIAIISSVYANQTALRRESTCIVAYSTANPTCEVLWQPDTTVEDAATALAGTTGTDGKTTIGCFTDGKLYIENRLGFANAFSILFLG
jgi:hypothetical protein